MVAGDFNAKSRVWGSSTNDSRGDVLLDAMSSMGFTSANDGSIPTFATPTRQSVIDVTFAREVEVNDWRVLDDTETLSDHRYLYFTLGSRDPQPPDSAAEPSMGWARGKLHLPALVKFLHANEPLTSEGPDLANRSAAALTSFLVRACDASTCPYQHAIIYIISI